MEICCIFSENLLLRTDGCFCVTDWPYRFKFLTQMIVTKSRFSIIEPCFMLNKIKEVNCRSYEGHEWEITSKRSVLKSFAEFSRASVLCSPILQNICERIIGLKDWKTYQSLDRYAHFLGRNEETSWIRIFKLIFV